MLRIIALRYHDSRVIGMDEFESVSNALGVIEEENADLRRYGYESQWSVYLVEGSHWYLLTNQEHSGARLDFMQFLKDNFGEYAGFKLVDFEAIDREDF